MNKKNLKNYIFIIGAIIIILIISISIFIVYSNNKDNKNLESKIEEEIRYLNDTLISMANKLNNINYENYVLVKEKSKTNNSNNNDQSSKESQSSSSEDKQSSGSGQSSSGGSSGGSGGDSQNSSGSEQSNTTTEQYQMKQYSVLNNNDNDNQIDWEYIKNKIEFFYSSWVNIVIDLHQNEVNNDDILNFGYEIDNLVASVKNENKIETLRSISKLYSYLPKYIEQTLKDNQKTYIYYTKSSIINSYALVEQENWEEVSSQMAKAQEYFINIINNVDGNDKNKINETYVLINETYNSISKKDKDIYYIKYKNLIKTIDMI